MPRKSSGDLRRHYKPLKIRKSRPSLNIPMPPGLSPCEVAGYVSVSCGSNKRAHSQIRHLYFRDNGRCKYCDNIVVMSCNPVYDEVGRHAQASRDHVIPRSKGGPDALTNLVLSCMVCNEAKGDN